MPRSSGCCIISRKHSRIAVGWRAKVSSLPDVQQLAAHLEALVEAARRRVGPRREARLEVLQQDRIELRDDFGGLVVALHHRLAARGATACPCAQAGRRARSADRTRCDPRAARRGNAAGCAGPAGALRAAQAGALRRARSGRCATRSFQRACPHPAGPRDPLDHLQVAQAAGRFLQVRLERVGRVLVLGVALLLLQLLRLEERRRVDRALAPASSARGTGCGCRPESAPRAAWCAR